MQETSVLLLWVHYLATVQRDDTALSHLSPRLTLLPPISVAQWHGRTPDLKLRGQCKYLRFKYKEWKACDQKPVARWYTEYCCVVTSILVTCVWIRSVGCPDRRCVQYQSTIISTRNAWIYYVKKTTMLAFSSILFSSYLINIKWRVVTDAVDVAFRNERYAHKRNQRLGKLWKTTHDYENLLHVSHGWCF
jgi:hypothetical protein